MRSSLWKFLPVFSALATCLASAVASAAPGEGTPTIAVDPAACRWVKQHRASADVNYQPGVDVQGRPVAPADLPGTAQIQLPERIEIPITLDLAERFGLPRTALSRTGVTAGEVQVGVVTLDGSQARFNGQPLSAAAEDELAVLCSRLPVTGMP